MSNYNAFGVFNYASRRKAFRLTEVCHHWRTVTLATTSLWCGVICGCDDLRPPEYHLHLSKGAPLHAIIKGDLEAAENILATYPARIQHLLMMDTTFWSRRYDPRRFLAHVTPDLLTCTLNLQSWPRGPRLPELRYNLFAPGGAERLRSLSVYTAKIIPNDHFPNLRVLNLYDIVGIPSFPHILSLIGRCPLVEEVCVHSDCMPGPSTPDGRWDLVELKHARKIALLFPNSAWILAHLALPLNALVRVDDFILEEQSKWSTLPAPLGPAAPNFTRLRIFPQESFIHDGIVGGLRVELAAAMNAHAGYCLNAIARSTVPSLVRYKTLVDIFDRTDSRFAHITVLWAVRIPMTLSLILSALPTIRVLGVVLNYGDTMIDLADTLRVRADGDLVCPSLSALYISHCQGCGKNLHSLRDTVVSRAQANHRIARVALRCAHTPNEDESTLAPHFAAIRQNVDEFTIIPRIWHSKSRSILPLEWREEWGREDDGVWPDWELFGGPRASVRRDFFK
ncbi:hypothetical protein BD309DRAFT_706612 [Dichomitus squalens]|uniref:Uncharacterized protein n=1 Tax=Dichomitus squalens TaxID=114155 RepID=A0A4Q9PUS8_9APHY|nr:hypothetical protein BD309DRAFT_706612 [Dichomitus squalens]TBU58104.1 hypothetical protein BD310DRAFT_503261 [Dichomitus squalens]